MREKKAKSVLEQVQETYNEIADEFSDSRATAWDEFQFFIPYLTKGQNIVDLGCGNGRLLDYLNKKTEGWDKPAFHYLGIDNSEKLLGKAHQIHPEAIFLPGDQLQIPIDDGKIDLIFNIAAFHHIPSKKLQMQALQEIHRILKKNGILCLTVWNLWQKKYWKSMLKALLRWIFTLGNYSIGDLFIPWGNKKIPRYYHAFLPGELEKLIKKSGFEIEELFYTAKGQKVHFKKSYNICIIAKKIS